MTKLLWYFYVSDPLICYRWHLKVTLTAWRMRGRLSKLFECCILCTSVVHNDVCTPTYRHLFVFVFVWLYFCYGCCISVTLVFMSFVYFLIVVSFYNQYQTVSRLNCCESVLDWDLQKIDFANNLQLSLTLTAMSIGLWWLFDRSRSGFGLGISIAVIATVVSQLLVYNGIYR